LIILINPMKQPLESYIKKTFKKQKV
jgi:hypothetical protein